MTVVDDAYSAGVYGSIPGNYADTAGVLGYDELNGYWGALGHQDGGSRHWAGYFNGPSYFSNNVGIGTLVPGTNLHVFENNTDVVPALRVEQASTGGAGMQFTIANVAYGFGIDNSLSTDALVITTAATTGGAALNSQRIMVIEGSGEVGIGTPYAGARLHVIDTSGGSPLQVSTTSASTTGLGVDSNNRVYIGPTSASAARLTVDNKAIAEDIFIANDNGTEVFEIEDGGNVGIGTDNPTSKLDVNGGSVTIRGTGTNGQLRVSSSVWLASEGGMVHIGTNTPIAANSTGPGLLDIWAGCVTTARNAITVSTGSTTAPVNIFRVRTNAPSVYGTGAFQATGADYAEYYISDDALDNGDLVLLNKGKKIVRSKGLSTDSDLAIGVVSEAPGMVTGHPDINKDDIPGYYPIALIGRVPARVSLENGPIKAGDYLTSSSKPGCAMKAVKSGRVIGMAMEAFPSSVIASSKGGSASGGSEAKQSHEEDFSSNEIATPAKGGLAMTDRKQPRNDKAKEGKILAFINPHYWVNPQEYEELKAKEAKNTILRQAQDERLLIQDERLSILEAKVGEMQAGRRNEKADETTKQSQKDDSSFDEIAAPEASAGGGSAFGGRNGKKEGVTGTELRPLHGAKGRLKSQRDATPVAVAAFAGMTAPCPARAVPSTEGAKRRMRRRSNPAPQPLERSPRTQKRRWREGSFGDGVTTRGRGRLKRTILLLMRLPRLRLAMTKKKAERAMTNWKNCKRRTWN
ncbi:MAG: hypothetical protein HY747_02105 [Elusimicrobia bacterium]|nr:hypothetical protein [Elusimicrobiota bacterium]